MPASESEGLVLTDQSGLFQHAQAHRHLHWMPAHLQ